MKKFLWVLLVCLLVLASFPALAEAETALSGGAFFDWETLGTFAGAVAVTVFIVQLLKLPLDKVWKVPTRAVCYMIALAVLVAAMVVTKGWDWSQFVLCVFNAALVALSAMSTYEVTIGRVEESKFYKDIMTAELADEGAQDSAGEKNAE